MMVEMTETLRYIFAAAAAGAGFACVYLPLSLVVQKLLRGQDTKVDDGTKEGKDEKPSGLSADQARELVGRLHTAATRITRNVDEHTSSIEEVSSELSNLDASDTEQTIQIVLAAVDRIGEANGKLTEQLADARSTIDKQAQLMETQLADALTDPLTAIANRRALDHELARRFAEWSRRKTPMSIMMIDVDHFKKFNDTHGHQAGDEVLRRVAQVLTKTMREMDLVVRYGGEEFAVVLPDTDIIHATPAADRARKAVAATRIPFEGATLQVTASVGVAAISVDDNARTLIKRSDAALYASKRAGRNCAHLHDGTHCRLIGERPVATPKAETPQTDRANEARQADEKRDSIPSQTEAPETGDAQEKEKTETDIIYTDKLTGLPTTAALKENLRRRLAEWRRLHVPLSLLVVALDDFPSIQRLGIKAEELVVDAVSKFLKASAREMDLVARHKEDQFAIMLPSCNLENAIAPAERVRKAIAACDKLQHDGTMIRFTISAGISEAASQDNPDAMIRRAEEAMQSAVQAGGNQTCPQTPEQPTRPATADSGTQSVKV